MAVLMAEPQSEVFEVKHTGFVVLQHQAARSAVVRREGQHAGSQQQRVGAVWKLTSSPGETGVLWLEDD